MNKRLFCKVSLRLCAGLALRLDGAICPYGLEKEKGIPGSGIPFFLIMKQHD